MLKNSRMAFRPERTSLPTGSSTVAFSANSATSSSAPPDWSSSTYLQMVPAAASDVFIDKVAPSLAGWTADQSSVMMTLSAAPGVETQRSASSRSSNPKVWLMISRYFSQLSTMSLVTSKISVG